MWCGLGKTQAVGVSPSAASHILSSRVLRLALISRSVLELCRTMFAKLVGFDQRITREFKPATFMTPFDVFAAELEGVCQAWCEMSREVPRENKILALGVLDVSLHGCRKTLQGSHHSLPACGGEQVLPLRSAGLGSPRQPRSGMLSKMGSPAGSHGCLQA